MVRDMTELSMISKDEWTNEELRHFHVGLQQMTPYLNSEGNQIHKNIVQEIETRGGLKNI